MPGTTNMALRQDIGIAESDASRGLYQDYQPGLQNLYARKFDQCSDDIRKFLRHNKSVLAGQYPESIFRIPGTNDQLRRVQREPAAFNRIQVTMFVAKIQRTSGIAINQS